MNTLNFPWIASFWARIGAFTLDWAILASTGFFLSLLLEPMFVSLGPWGRLVGFVMALTYFGCLNSSIAKGQTLGKKALDIRVVDQNNQCIKPSVSFFRSSFIAIPFALNGAQFSSSILNSPLLYLISMVIFGFFLSLAYLLVFNKATRQSLHDLATGTYVVNAHDNPQEISAIWKPHYYIVFAIFLVSALSPIFLASSSNQIKIEQLISAKNSLVILPDVSYATVASGVHNASDSDGNDTSFNYVDAKAYLTSDSAINDDRAKSIYSILNANFNSAASADYVFITLLNGFDIGVWSKWKKLTFQFKDGELILDEDEEPAPEADLE